MDEWEVIGEGPSVSPGTVSIDPIGGGMPQADEWEVIGVGPSAPSNSWKDYAAGMAGSIGAGTTFNLVDEAAAGVRSGISSAQSALGFEPSFQDYGAELAAIRGGQKKFDDNNPIASIFGNVGGALALPVGGLAKGATTLTGKAAALAAEGGVIGSLFGFGGGEGTEDRLKDAAKTGAISAMFAPAVGIGAEKLSSKLSSAADAVAPLSKEQTLVKQLGITASDIAKAGGKDKLDDAITTAIRKGVIAGEDPVAWSQAADDAVSSLGDEVTGILQAADKAGKEVPLPDFGRAEQFIQANPFQKDALRDQFNRRVSSLIDLWDGSVSGLNSLKQGLYKIAYSGSSDSKLLDRAIASDIKTTIEKAVSSNLGDEAAAAVKNLHAEQGKYLSLSDVFEKAINRGAAKEMRGGSKFSVLSTPALTGGGIATSLATGDPTIAAATIGTALTKDAINSNAGKFVASKGLKGASAITDLFKGPATTSDVIDSLFRLKESEQGRAGKAQKQGQESKPASEAEQKSPRSELLLSPNSKVDQSSSNSTPVSTVIQEQDPLVQAIIHVESKGEERAVSNKGAKGLMQLMPDNIKAFGVKDPFDPKENIRGGTALLKEELERFKDTELALAAYNAGSPKVRAAIEKAGSRDFDKIKKYLPEETQKYVSLVLDRYSKLV